MVEKTNDDKEKALEMTITRPLRRMTLHFSQMGFTEGLTFMMLNLLLVDALTLIWSAR